MTISIIHSDNLPYLKAESSNSINLIYIDPPFNTGKKQTRKKIKAKVSQNGLEGFGGNKYKREDVGEYGSFEDTFEDFPAFLKPRLEEAHRILKDDGAIYVHLDYREVHYIKVMMDGIFGRENFINEIIWCYEFGAKSKSKWSAKHDDILYYVKDKSKYTFNFDKIPRIPYLAPGLVGPEKAALGKTVVDWWRETIVPTNSKEKQGYATQKPLRILRRIVDVCSNPGDVCMDFFAGSGSFGEACLELGRDCILVDQNPEAIEVMKKRFAKIIDVGEHGIV